MYKGDTIQELVAAVDAIRERRSGNAVEQVFTNPPHLGNSDHDRTRPSGSEPEPDLHGARLKFEGKRNAGKSKMISLASGPRMTRLWLTPPRLTQNP